MSLERRLTVVESRNLNVRTSAAGVAVFPTADVNSCAARVNNLASKHAPSWKDRGGMISLSLGDADTGTMPDKVINAHDDAFRSSREVPYAPIPGAPKLRDVVASNMRNMFGVPNATADQVLPIAGSRFGEAAFMEIFYASPDYQGRKMLVVDPCWATGPQQAQKVGGRDGLIEAMLPYDKESLFARLTPAMLDDLLDRHPEIGGILFTNPNNPTGHLATRDEMREFAEIFASRRLLVLEDATYGYITFGHSVSTLFSVANDLKSADRDALLERTALVLGLQKLVGSGLRVSAVVAQSPDLLASFTGLVSNYTGPVNAPAQAAAAVLYSDYGALNAANSVLARRRVALASALEQARVNLRRVHDVDVFEHTLGQVVTTPTLHGGGYYAVMKLHPKAIARICETMGISELTSDAVMEFFAGEVGTKVQAGITMRLDDTHIRLAFGAVSEDHLKLFGERLEAAFK